MSKIKLVIDSCYENIDLIGTCIESLSSRLFEDQQCNQINVCVYEAVTNCIRHSYKGSRGHDVYISFDINENRLILDVSDSGLAMNPKILESTSTTFQIDPENPQEGGMGLKIIKSLMDEVSYHTEQGINHLTMIKYT